MAFAAAEPDRTAETFHDAFHQHQPHPQSTLFGGKERPKSHTLLLFVHALAIVGQTQGQAAPVVTYHLDTQPPALLHRLQGIGDQATEHLAQQYRVPQHLHGR